MSGESGASAQERTPAGEVVELLREEGATLAVAESCTGGWLGREITAIPGASTVFWGGAIAYSDLAKEVLLGVAPDLLAEYGAVSAEVARAMAREVRARSGATWGVAITGIAGPGGGRVGRPVGTVWFAIDGPARAVWTERFAGDREEIRLQAVREALEELKRLQPGGKADG